MTIKDIHYVQKRKRISLLISRFLDKVTKTKMSPEGYYSNFFGIRVFAALKAKLNLKTRTLWDLSILSRVIFQLNESSPLSNSYINFLRLRPYSYSGVEIQSYLFVEQRLDGARENSIQKRVDSKKSYLKIDEYDPLNKTFKS